MEYSHDLHKTECNNNIKQVSTLYPRVDPDCFPPTNIQFIVVYKHIYEYINYTILFSTRYK